MSTEFSSGPYVAFLQLERLDWNTIECTFRLAEVPPWADSALLACFTYDSWDPHIKSEITCKVGQAWEFTSRCGPLLWHYQGWSCVLTRFSLGCTPFAYSPRPHAYSISFKTRILFDDNEFLTTMYDSLLARGKLKYIHYCGTSMVVIGHGADII
jgi:hypothetical protein